MAIRNADRQTVSSHRRVLAGALVAAVMLSAIGTAPIPQSGSVDTAVGVPVGIDRLEGDVFGPPIGSTLRTLRIPLGDAAPTKVVDVVEIRDLLVPRLTLPVTRDAIVMVEWATGRNVARWDAEVRRVRAIGPVDPIVVR
jgi:hypothetical protein